MHPVSTLHFLVHPCYQAKHVEEYHDWASMYINAFRASNAHDLLTVFLDTKEKNYKKRSSEKQKNLHILTDQLQEIFGKRLLVLCREWEIFSKKKEIRRTMRHILETFTARDYIISRHTPTVASGEYTIACVSEAAKNLHRAGDFINPTLIRSDIGDLYELSQHQRLANVPMWRQEHSSRRIIYDVEMLHHNGS